MGPEPESAEVLDYERDIAPVARALRNAPSGTPWDYLAEIAIRTHRASTELAKTPTCGECGHAAHAGRKCDGDPRDTSDSGIGGNAPREAQGCLCGDPEFAQAPNDEPLRALVAKATRSAITHWWNDGPRKIWRADFKDPERRAAWFDDLARSISDALEALLPRSVQAQLTDEQIEAEVALRLRRAPEFENDRELFRNGMRVARALLARAARGQDEFPGGREHYCACGKYIAHEHFGFIGVAVGHNFKNCLEGQA